MTKYKVGTPHRKKRAWIVFRHNGKELCRYSVQGTAPGELKSTLELLAYENDIPESEISWKVEWRGS